MVRVFEGVANQSLRLGVGSDETAQKPKNQKVELKPAAQAQVEESGFVGELTGSALSIAGAVGKAANSLAALANSVKWFSQTRTTEQLFNVLEKTLSQAKHQLHQEDYSKVEALLLELEKTEFPVLQKQLDNPEKHPRLQFLLGKTALMKAELARFGSNAEGAGKLYQEAVMHFNRADENSVMDSSFKGKICHFRALANKALGNYEAVLADKNALAYFSPAAGRQENQSQDQENQNRVADLKIKADLAHEQGDIMQEAALLSQALNFREALGEEVPEEELDYLKELAREVLAEQTLGRLEEQALDGQITPEILNHFEKLSQLKGTPFYETRMNLKDWIELEPNAARDGYVLNYTNLFMEAPDNRRLEILSAMQAISLVGEVRDKAAKEIHPLKKAYADGMVALLDGNVSEAKIRFSEVWRQRDRINDPELQALTTAAGEMLRQFALAHIEQMKAYTETLYFDRHGSEHEGSDRRREDDLREISRETLSLLQGILERGEAHTLEEAIQVIEAQAARNRAAEGESGFEVREWDYLASRGPKDSQVSLARRADSFLYNSAHPEIGKKQARGGQMAIEGGDKYFFRLLNLETSSMWAKTRTEEGLKKEYIDVGNDLRGWGSEQIAAQFYERVMSEDMARYAEQVREGVWHETNNIFTEKKLREEIEEQLKTLKKEDPGLYAQRFPQGKPTQADLDSMLEDSKQNYFQSRLKQETFRLIHEKGASDSKAQEAWREYRDMTDILDETGEISDDGWNAIIKEATIMAITMPLVMGAGSGVRGALLASKWGRRALSYSGLTSALFRGGTFIAGATVEGAIMTLPQAMMTGKFDTASVGHNIVMSMIFHGAGKAWKGFSADLGIDDVARGAMKKSGKIWRSRGAAVLDTAGMINLQSMVGTMVMDPDNKSNVIDSYLGHVVRNLGFHLGAETMRGIAPGLMNWEGEILNEYKNGGSSQPPPDGNSPPPSDGSSSQLTTPPNAGARSLRSSPTIHNSTLPSSNSQSQLTIADRVANQIWEGVGRVFNRVQEKLFGDTGGLGPGWGLRWAVEGAGASGKNITPGDKILSPHILREGQATSEYELPVLKKKELIAAKDSLENIFNGVLEVIEDLSFKKSSIRKLKSHQVQALLALHEVKMDARDTLLEHLLRNPNSRKVLMNLSRDAAYGMIHALKDPQGPRILRELFTTSESTREILYHSGSSSRAKQFLEIYPYISKYPNFVESCERVFPSLRNESKGGEQVFEEHYSWEGLMDELIILGRLAKRTEEYPEGSIKAEKINAELGEITYNVSKGDVLKGLSRTSMRELTHSIEADAFGDGVLHEIKSSEFLGGAGTISWEIMSFDGRQRFVAQAFKYRAAIEEGRIEAVHYHMVAKEIDPAVMAFLKETIPHLQITQYKSISDTRGETVVFQGMEFQSQRFIKRSLEEGRLVFGKEGGKLESIQLSTDPVRPIEKVETGRNSIELIQEHARNIFESENPTAQQLMRNLKHYTRWSRELLVRLPETQCRRFEAQLERLFDKAIDLEGTEGLEKLTQEYRELLQNYAEFYAKKTGSKPSIVEFGSSPWRSEHGVVALPPL